MQAFHQRIIFCILLLGLMANMPTSAQSFMFSHPMLGQPAPDFTLTTVRGNAVNLTAARAGQPAMVFFWATWCPHCRQELRKLYKQLSTIEQKGIRVIIVDIQESAQQVQGYLRRQKINADICLDLTGEVVDRYRVLGIPVYFLIDAQGIIRTVKNTFPNNYSGLLVATPQHIPRGQSALEQAGVNE